jgi:hypothetical protein
MFETDAEMSRLNPDKLTELYSQRIPEVLSKNLSKLTPEEKKRLCDRILVLMAKAVHDHAFNPNQYISTEQL